MDSFRDYRYNIPGFFLLLTFVFYCVDLTQLPIVNVKQENISIALIGVLAGSLILYCFGYIPACIGGYFAKRFTDKHLRKPPTSPFDELLTNESGKLKPSDRRIYISILQHTILTENQLAFLTRRLTNIYVSINSISAILIGELLSWLLWHKSIPFYILDPGLWILFIICLILIWHTHQQIKEFNRAIIIYYEKWEELTNNKLRKNETPI